MKLSISSLSFSLVLATVLLLPSVQAIMSRFSFANETSPTSTEDATTEDTAASSPGPICRETYSRNIYETMEDYCDYGKVQIYDLPSYYDYETESPTSSPTMSMPSMGKKGAKRAGMSLLEEEAEYEPTCESTCHTRIVLESTEHGSCGDINGTQAMYPSLLNQACGGQLVSPCALDTPIGVNTYTRSLTRYGNAGGYHEQIHGMLSMHQVVGGIDQWMQMPYSSSLLMSYDVRTPVVYHLGGAGSFPHLHGFMSPLNWVTMGGQEYFAMGGQEYFAMLLHYCDDSAPSSSSSSYGDCGPWDVQEKAHLHLPACWVYNEI